MEMDIQQTDEGKATIERFKQATRDVVAICKPDEMLGVVMLFASMLIDPKDEDDPVGMKMIEFVDSLNAHRKRLGITGTTR